MRLTRRDGDIFVSSIQKNGTATNIDKDWQKRKDLGIHTSDESHEQESHHEHTREKEVTGGRGYGDGSNLVYFGEQSVTITEILLKRDEWNFLSMLLILHAEP